MDLAIAARHFASVSSGYGYGMNKWPSGFKGRLTMQTMLRGFKGFLRKASYWPGFILGTKRTFPTWKTITLGTHKSVRELYEDLRSNGFWAHDQGVMEILKKVPLSTVEKKLSLVNVSFQELGFKRPARDG